MTRILIPMAGAGSRFSEAGYTLPKSVIATTDRRTGERVPMVVAAARDLPAVPHDPVTATIFILRDFHRDNGVAEQILVHYPQAQFIVVDRLTEGQASTCLLAKEHIHDGEALLIGACDNGMDIDSNRFVEASVNADAVIFTFRNNPAVTVKPEAYGWIQTKPGSDEVTGVSIKKPISATPMRDHAVVGTFWFRQGRDFVEAAETMISANERIKGEFYVDQVFRNMIERGKRIKVFEVDRYICWGTPQDYEGYENTIRYWKDHMAEEGL